MRDSYNILLIKPVVAIPIAITICKNIKILLIGQVMNVNCQQDRFQTKTQLTISKTDKIQRAEGTPQQQPSEKKDFFKIFERFLGHRPTQQKKGEALHHSTTKAKVLCLLSLSRRVTGNHKRGGV